MTWPAFPANFWAGRELKRQDIEASRIIDAITSVAHRRWTHHPIPRPETMIDLARDWREKLPKLGRLDLEITRERNGLTIHELRAGAVNFHAVDWDPDAIEAGISILRMSLVIAPREFSFAIRNLASASLHAIARRFQRSFEDDEAAILRDLHALARHRLHLPEREPGAHFAFEIGDGVWRGIAVDIGKDGTVLCARTFVPND